MKLKAISLILLLLALPAMAGEGFKPEADRPLSVEDQPRGDAGTAAGPGGVGFSFQGVDLCFDGGSHVDLGTAYNSDLADGLTVSFTVALGPTRAPQWLLQNLDTEEAGAGFFIRYNTTLERFEFGFKAHPTAEVFTVAPSPLDEVREFSWTVTTDGGVLAAALHMDGALVDTDSVAYPFLAVSQDTLLLGESPEHVLYPLRPLGCISGLTVF